MKRLADIDRARAGSEVTGGMGRGVAVRLIARAKARIRRVMEDCDPVEREAPDTVRRRDQSRSRLVRKHVRVDIDDPTRYDAVWNTGQTPIPAIAESIAANLRREMGAAPATARS